MSALLESRSPAPGDCQCTGYTPPRHFPRAARDVPGGARQTSSRRLRRTTRSTGWCPIGGGRVNRRAGKKQPGCVLSLGRHRCEQCHGRSRRQRMRASCEPSARSSAQSLQRVDGKQGCGQRLFSINLGRRGFPITVTAPIGCPRSVERSGPQNTQCAPRGPSQPPADPTGVIPPSEVTAPQPRPRASHVLPNRDFWEAASGESRPKCLFTLVGVQGFEPWTR